MLKNSESASQDFCQHGQLQEQVEAFVPLGQ